jgi:hypothetical protein
MMARLAFAIVLVVARLSVAAPGDPFGGDDTGCVPATKPELGCSVKVGKLLSKLIVSVLRCHMDQGAAAFRGAGSGEQGCEQSAKSKFESDLAKLTHDGICAQAVLDNAATQEGVLLADQTQTSPPSLDALNGTIFCDATSGVPIAGTPGDPDDDDAGFVPATAENLKCAIGVAKNVIKLWSGILVRCHTKAAVAGFKSSAFDEEACENAVKVGIRSRYDALAAKLTAAGICPACLDASGQATIGDDIQSRADQENGLVFVCP